MHIPSIICGVIYKSAAYDTFDYPNYWVGREYEHKAEVIAISGFLSKIKKIGKILDIGVGFGRLTPTYIFRGKNIILTDPSAKLLAIAKKEFNRKNVKFIRSPIEKLPSKIRKNSVDLILIVRVLHHIKDLDKSIRIIHNLLKPNGYLIIEFPNKIHLKAAITELLRGNLTFFLDIYPKDVRSSKSKKEKTLPFFNYHPDIIRQKLRDSGFTIIEQRSVSNIRSNFIKKLLTIETLLFLENQLQKPFSRINFGPSIFILAKKT